MFRNQVITLILCLAFIGCGGSSPNANNANSQQNTANTANSNRRENRRVGQPIEIKLKDKPTEFEPKSAHYFSEDLTMNTADGKTVQTVVREIVIANYQLDASGGKESVMKKLTSPEQMRLVIQLVEGPDAKKERATTATEFRLRANEPYSLMGIQVYTFANGKEVKTSISPGGDARGSVRVSSTSSELVSGEIDISNSELAIFGSYIAMAWKPPTK